MGNLLNMSGGSLLERKSTVDWSQEYLTFEALESGTFQFTNTCQYSLNGGATWTNLAANTASPTLNAGDKIIWRATNPTVNNVGIGTFSSTCYYNAMGNPLSMRFGDNYKDYTSITSNGCLFKSLFENNTNLISVENLILVLLAPGSIYYYKMFKNCNRIEIAPVILAETLTEYACCNQMFYGCSSLKYIKCLATTINEGNVMSNWVVGVASEGTFVKHPDAVWPSQAGYGIPSGWTVETASK